MFNIVWKSESTVSKTHRKEQTCKCKKNYVTAPGGQKYKLFWQSEVTYRTELFCMHSSTLGRCTNKPRFSRSLIKLHAIPWSNKIYSATNVTRITSHLNDNNSASQVTEKLLYWCKQRKCHKCSCEMRGHRHEDERQYFTNVQPAFHTQGKQTTKTAHIWNKNVSYSG